MSKFQRYEHCYLLTPYTCTDDSHLIIDTGSSLQVLDNYSQFLDITKNPDDGILKGTRKKAWTTVSTAGFVVKFHVKCKPCKTVSEFINKSETNFNACVAAAGLVGGINRKSLQMILACVGITLQLVLQKVIEHHKANKSYKLVLIALGLMYIMLNKKMRIIQEGHFELSSHKMKHAILIALLEKLTPILEEQVLLLNVTIDDDLDSNKMLELSIRYLQSYKWNGF
nr:4753_t:CDS:2 [Entrophospora candida]